MEIKKETRPDTDLLQSVLHNSEIGIVAINDILPEAESAELIKTLKEQKQKFVEITKKAKELSKQYEITLKPNSALKKGKMWLSIKMSTLFNDETRHIAEMMILGHFMGTINMIKSLADCKDAKGDILKLARDLKKVEEDSVNELVPYLENTKK